MKYSPDGVKVVWEGQTQTGFAAESEITMPKKNGYAKATDLSALPKDHPDYSEDKFNLFVEESHISYTVTLSKEKYQFILDEFCDGDFFEDGYIKLKGIKYEN